MNIQLHINPGQLEVELHINGKLCIVYSLESTIYIGDTLEDDKLESIGLTRTTLMKMLHDVLEIMARRL